MFIYLTVLSIRNIMFRLTLKDVTLSIVRKTLHYIVRRYATL